MNRCSRSWCCAASARPATKIETFTKTLRDWVTEQLGAIARPDDIRFADNLPKTRSGKIMRRLLRAIARNEDITQDLSTLENPAIIDQLRGGETPTKPRAAGAKKKAAPKKAGGEEARLRARKKASAEQESRVKKKPRAEEERRSARRRSRAKKASREEARTARRHAARNSASAAAADQAQHRDEVTGNAAQHEQVPDRVRVAARLPDVERHAAGVQQAAGDYPGELARPSGSRAAA